MTVKNIDGSVISVLFTMQVRIEGTCPSFCYVAFRAAASAFSSAAPSLPFDGRAGGVSRYPVRCGERRSRVDAEDRVSPHHAVAPTSSATNRGRFKRRPDNRRLHFQPYRAQFLIEPLDAEPGGNTPERYARLIAAEAEKWKKVVAATAVKTE